MKSTSSSSQSKMKNRTPTSDIVRRTKSKMRSISSAHSLDKYSDQESYKSKEIKEELEENDGFFNKSSQKSVDKLTVKDHLDTTSKARHHSHKKAEQISEEQHSMWRQEQKSSAALLEQQLNAKWTLEALIDKQLKHFHALYKQAKALDQLEDVAQLLMPKWTPPLEMALVGWLGDWRPSAILELLQSLVRSSCLSSSSADSLETGRMISQQIREIRIEEAILDEEMAEIQATCILNLPFSQANQTSASPLACFQSELKKMKQVIIKGQHLRFRVLELIVKKVLSQVDAAEFLVAFAGIQDAIHQFAAKEKNIKGVVNVSLKALRTS